LYSEGAGEVAAVEGALKDEASMAEEGIAGI
jgi:hypothetical protein